MKRYPCDGCKKRKPACQDTCEELKLLLAARQKKKQLVREEKIKEKRAEEFKTVCIEKVKRRKK